MVGLLLELARRQADAAEVYLEHSEERPIQFENNELKYIHTKSRRAASLRVIADGRLGFASTTDLSAPKRLVAQAIESARFGQPARFAFPGQADYPHVAVLDPAVVNFPVQRGVELGRDAIDQVRAAVDDVLCGVQISKWFGHTHIANTSGLDYDFESTGFDADLSAVRIRDGGILWVGEGDSSRRLCHDFERYAAKVVADIRRAETESDPPAGPCPVLFTAKAVALLVEFLETAVNGKLVQKGVSPLGGRLGERVLDPRITLADDGTRDFGDGSAPHDGEGTATRRTPLFERGVLRNYLFDLQTAGLMRAAATGNAARGFAAPPRPGATNLVLARGSDRFGHLVAGMDRGLLVDQVLGGGQSNVLAGEFSVNVGLGFLIERGELHGRVKDCMIAGNVFESLNRLRGLCRTQETHGAIVAPALCLDDVAVASVG